jgi:hypothetical protein
MFAILIIASLSGGLIQFTKTTIGEYIRYEGTTDSSFEFDECVFMGRNFGGGGGAMTIQGASIVMRDTLFFQCYAEWVGGAVFCSTSNFQMTRCCAAECYTTGERGHFMEWHALQEGTGYQSILVAHESTIYNCGSVSSTKANWGTIVSNAGIARLSGFNFTSCAVSQWGATFYHNADGDVIAENLLVVGCKGPTIFDVPYNNRHEVTVDHCEFYGNSASKAIVHFNYVTSPADSAGKVVKNCIFADNIGNGEYIVSEPSGDGQYALKTVTGCVFDGTPIYPQCIVAPSGNLEKQKVDRYERTPFSNEYCPGGAAPAAEATPKATPKETPKVTPEETPKSTPEQTPKPTPEETPKSTPEETPKSTLEETPKSTPDETARSTPEETPKSTSEETPVASMQPSPSSSLPAQSALQTAARSSDQTSTQTPSELPTESRSNCPAAGPGGGGNQDGGNPDGSNGASVGMIAGIAAGAVAVAALLIVFFIFRRRSARSEDLRDSSDGDPEVAFETEGTIEVEGDITHDYCNPIFDEDKLAPAPDSFDDSADEMLLL